MKKTMLFVMSVTAAIVFAVLAIGPLTPYASATCYDCEYGGGGNIAQGGGIPLTGGEDCNPVGHGYSICVQSDQEPYCQLIDPGCQDECLACGDGCCASQRDNKNKSCPKLKEMAFQTSDEPTGTRNSNYGDNKHLQIFLDALEAGKFDGKKIVYLAEDNPIIKGLLEMPADHWKTFEKRVRVQGTPERGAAARGELSGKPQTYLYIETKTAHTVTIHIDDANANNKKQNKASPTT